MVLTDLIADVRWRVEHPWQAAWRQVRVGWLGLSFVQRAGLAFVVATVATCATWGALGFVLDAVSR
jgi:hypothetical protein